MGRRHDPESLRRYPTLHHDDDRPPYPYRLRLHPAHQYSRALEALIDEVIGHVAIKAKPESFAILSDNGSEFMKEFDALPQKKNITHYWTYPNNPKMNAHNERFNRSLQEQYVDFHEDLLFTDIPLFNQMMAEWLSTTIPKSLTIHFK